MGRRSSVMRLATNFDKISIRCRLRSLIAINRICNVPEEQRIGDVTREIEAIASREDAARRLMTSPGIGAMGAAALLAAIGSGLQF